ncbi:hypothetical protein ACIPEL_36465 [Streptomyces griseoviridis]
MTVPEWMNAGVSGVVMAAVVFFMWTYHRHAPWRSSGMGRYLMAFAGTIGLLATYTVTIYVVGYVVGLGGAAAGVLRLVRSALLLVVAGLLVQGGRVIRREQRRSR